MNLITGLSGFVGQNLYKFLKSEGIAGILSLSRTKGDGHQKVLLYDDFFADSTVSATHYIHLAGKAHDLKKTTEDRAYFEVNLELTKKLINRFLADPKSKSFIFISSVKTCRHTVDGWLMEETACNPKTAYGQSKRKAEEYLMAYLAEERNVYILRPCIIHGFLIRDWALQTRNSG